MGIDHNLSLGQFLRHEREKKGMTIEQVASATKINVRLLHALEEDQYQGLPAKPFIRGFVTSYSRFVGLDPREVITQFTTYIDHRAQDRPNKESGHSGYAFEKREGDQLSRTVLGSIMGVIIAGGAIVIFMKPSFLKHKSAHIDRLKSAHLQATPSPSPYSSPVALQIALNPPFHPPLLLPASPLPSPVPHPTDPLNAGMELKPEETKHKVRFKALESIWVRYQVDSRPLTQFVLKEGKTLTLRAQNLIKFQISNPAQISLSYNNGEMIRGDAKQLFSSSKNGQTLFFPSSAGASFLEPFPQEKPVATLPTPRKASPSASPRE